MSEIEQRTEEWRQARAGCITASRMRDLVWEPGNYKTGPRAGQPKDPPESRTGYIDQIVAEILTGQTKEDIRARALDYGREMEPEATARYEALRGCMVEQAGFITHKAYPFIGASPDFLVDADGGGEIKCPISITVHAATLRAGLPKEHIEQIQGGLWVTERRWWDFISYHPAFPPGLDLYVQRVTRDSAYIEVVKGACLSAWEEVQDLLERFNAMRDAHEAV